MSFIDRYPRRTLSKGITGSAISKPPPSWPSIGGTIGGKESFQDLAAQWQSSLEWTAYADGTKRLYAGNLRALSKQWGDVPLRLFNDPRMRSKVLKYRAENLARPAGIDAQICTLNSLLNFGISRKKLSLNVAAGIPDLYRKGQRALICWSEADLEQFVSTSVKLGVPNVGDVALLMSECGLRPQDLITATLGQVQKCALVKKALKRSRRRRRFAIIPRTPSLDQVLEVLRSRYRLPGVTTLLVNHDGLPWHMAALDHLVRRVRRASRLVEKRLYDLRGTFATRLVTGTDLTSEEIAEIMGWSVDTVRRIQTIYVDHDKNMEAAGRRLSFGLEF